MKLICKVVIPLMMLLTIAACGGSGGGDSGPTDGGTTNIDQISGEIGTSGGTIEISEGSLYEGTNLVIPAGALPESTQITITVEEQPSEGTIIFILEPNGLTFNVPSTLTLKYSEEYLNEQGTKETELKMYLQDSQTGEWELLDSNVNQTDNTVSADIEHFSNATYSDSIHYKALLQHRQLIDAWVVPIVITPQYDQFNPTFGTSTQLVVSEFAISVSLSKGNLEDFFAGTGRNLILVHGVLSDAGTFFLNEEDGSENSNDLVNSLSDEYDNVILYNYPSGKPIEENANGLRDLILDDPRLGPSFKTDIIAHSMGGLVGRYAIEKSSPGIGPYVNNLVMLGTPNNGSPLGTVIVFGGLSNPLTFPIVIKANSIFPGLSQLATGSAFLNDLNSTDQSTIDTKYYVIAGDVGGGSDGWVSTTSALSVNPDDSLVLNGVDHFGLHTEAATNGVASRIVYWINSAEAPPEGTVITATGRIWMDRNLGASRVATSLTDTEAYGDLYQRGRGADGHQVRTSPTTSILSSTVVPGHGYFITNPNSPFSWTTVNTNDLWQGVDGINNPCPAGFRLPTETEFNTERSSWVSDDAAGAFASPLKLVMGGYRGRVGQLIDVGTSGHYYAISGGLTIYSDYATENDWNRVLGVSIRCIMD